MELGDLVGAGRTAEVYAVGTDRVVKLLRPGFDPAALAIEARKTQAAHDAGVAAPRSYGPVSIDGRSGHLFDRADGALMLEVIRGRPWGYRRFADLLAEVHVGMHARHGNGLPDARERLAAAIDQGPLDGALQRAAKDRLAGLEDGDRVLHGDFHPGNVVLGDDGPVVIDWLDSAQGSPAADVARTLWLLSPPTIEPGTRFGRILGAFVDAFRRRYLRSYLAAAPLDLSVVRAWRLPVLAGRLGEGIEHETGPLMAEMVRLAGPTP